VIVGIGVDVVNVPRFGATMRRTPGLRERLFTPVERVTAEGAPRSEASLAVRFAAKEAVAKALGAPGGLRWHDCQVVSDAHGRPWLRTTGTVAALAEKLGVRRWHLSLTHDADTAIAYVVAEGADGATVAVDDVVVSLRAADDPPDANR
jgi:holo-[acyl-carrier protein] synthase